MSQWILYSLILPLDPGNSAEEFWRGLFAREQVKIWVIFTLAWFDSVVSLVLASETPDWPALTDSWWQLLSGALCGQAQNCQSEHTRKRAHTHTPYPQGIRKGEKAMCCTTKQVNEVMKGSDLSEIRGDEWKEEWKYKGGKHVGNGQAEKWIIQVDALKPWSWHQRK